MFTTYAGLALAVLKFVNGLMDMVDQQQMQKSGADAEIAKTSAAILAKTQAGKAIMEKVNAMSDKDVDSGLTDLEPK
jgi:uncharacterized protein YjbI with pentapeptide repeats